MSADAPPTPVTPDVHEAAEILAVRALGCLERGEKSQSSETRLAAYHEGRELARLAVAADDGNADAHYALFATSGRIMQSEGAAATIFNVFKATRELDRTLQLNPNHADALAAKGSVYRQLPWFLGGSLKKAADFLRRAIAVDANAVGSRIELAEVYRDMGDTKRGITVLEEAERIAEKNGRTDALIETRQLLAQFHAQP